MRYRIEYADGKCCNFANSRKDLLDWLKLLKDEQIVDIRKIYKSGVTDSVLDSYRRYLNSEGVDEDVEAYMSQHRHDTDIQELKTYFTSVIDWISGVFSDVESEMRGIEWGRLFETYHNQPYDPVEAGSGT